MLHPPTLPFETYLAYIASIAAGVDFGLGREGVVPSITSNNTMQTSPRPRSPRNDSACPPPPSPPPSAAAAAASSVPVLTGSRSGIALLSRHPPLLLSSLFVGRRASARPSSPITPHTFASVSNRPRLGQYRLPPHRVAAFWKRYARKQVKQRVCMVARVEAFNGAVVHSISFLTALYYFGRGPTPNCP